MRACSSRRGRPEGGRRTGTDSRRVICLPSRRAAGREVPERAETTKARQPGPFPGISRTIQMQQRGPHIEQRSYRGMLRRRPRSDSCVIVLRRRFGAQTDHKELSNG
ncbi:hypothetical protein TRVL_09116 [Trypanosoma vivax]|nr:hypothetical protein TRVL_09116 [Trypanosoma vivax]